MLTGLFAFDIVFETGYFIAGGTQMTAITELNPDVVIHVRFPQQDGSATPEAEKSLSKLLSQLDKFGFHAQIRPDDFEQLLVFVKLSNEKLSQLLKDQSVKEYLYGLRNEFGDDDSNLSSNDRIPLVYGALVNPLDEGGAGITVNSGDWAFVTKIAPIWDVKESESLLKSVLKFSFTERDVERIREVAGSRVALYFEFLRNYYNWLVIASIGGVISSLLFKRFSIIFTFLNALWGIVFLSSWKKREDVLRIQWGLQGVDKIQVRRQEYVGVTNELDSAYSPNAGRTLKKLAFIPVAIVAAIILLSYQIACFFIEIFLTEIYQGPGKLVLGLVPTALIVGGVPIFTAIYEIFINKALTWENHEFQSTFEKSQLEKLYVYNFLSSYVPLFITAFFYLPFGHIVNSYLQSIGYYTSYWRIPIVNERYQINTQRLITQFSYFTLTAQVVSLLTENVVPIALKLVKQRINANKKFANLLDAPEEKKYLDNVREQLDRPSFDVNSEYRELATQFGYIVLFGPVWSLSPLASLFFNWIEIRGDVEKLLFESSRPIPQRVESIRPWNTHLRILTLIGSVVGPLVTTMYRNEDNVLQSSDYSYTKSVVSTSGWKLFAICLICENLFLGLSFAVDAILGSRDDRVEREHNESNVHLRRSYVEAYVKSDLSKNTTALSHRDDWEEFHNEKVLKQALELPSLLAGANKLKVKEKGLESENHTNIGEKSSGFQQHEKSDLRSTVASKSIPKTEVPVILIAEQTTPVTTANGTSQPSQVAVPISTKLNSSGNSNSTIPAVTNATISPSKENEETANSNNTDDSPTKRSSISSFSSSLAGATLPPDFEKRLSNSRLNVISPAQRERTPDLRKVDTPASKDSASSSTGSKQRESRENQSTTVPLETPLSQAAATLNDTIEATSANVASSAKSSNTEVAHKANNAVQTFSEKAQAVVAASSATVKQEIAKATTNVPSVAEPQHTVEPVTQNAENHKTLSPPKADFEDHGSLTSRSSSVRKKGLLSKVKGAIKSKAGPHSPHGSIHNTPKK